MNITRRLIFVNNRFNYLYRFKDKFQLFPYDPSLKGPSNLHIPLCLEFSFNPKDIPQEEGMPDGISKHDFLTKEANTLLFLLTIFTQYRFFNYNDGQYWFYPARGDNENEDNNLRSGYKNIKSLWGQKSLFGEINDEKTFLCIIDRSILFICKWVIIC